MFSTEFRKKLQGGKYTHWAADLKEEQLEALFWAVGELGGRASEPLEVLRRHATRDGMYARYNTGLECLADFTNGHPMDLKRFLERLRRARMRAYEGEGLEIPVHSAFFRGGQMVLMMTSGMELRFPVAANPRLAAGTEEQLNQIEISLYGIHWPALSVVLPFRRLFEGDYGQETTRL
jgi:hypothetical protein